MSFFRNPGSFREVRDATLRSNHSDNVKLHYFSARASVYFTYALLHTPITANGVTYVFIAIGLLSGLCFIPQDPSWHLLGWALFRLHVLLDVVDGEIARFRRSQNPMGAYLDFCSHYLLYATTIFGMLFGYYQEHPEAWVVVCLFLFITGYQLNIASRDTWYRAMFSQPREPAPPAAEAPSRSDGHRLNGPASLVIKLGLSVVNFNNFIFLFLFSTVVDSLLPIEQWLWGHESKQLLILGYSMIYPVFSVARVIYTFRSGRMLNRTNWEIGAD